jgi:hypothetical protein
MQGELKCDAEGCGHVEAVGVVTEAHVGKPCPRCGANLLTRKDWKTWEPIQAMMIAIQDIAGPPSQDADVAKIRVGIRGPKTTIEIDKPKPSN